MLNIVRKFFLTKNPDIMVKAPSRINLINPLDAVEGDYWMPAVAINGYKNPLSTFVYIKRINLPSCYNIYEFKDNAIELISSTLIETEKLKLREAIEKKRDLIKATIFRFSQTHPGFWENFFKENLEIGILTTIPRQSGLGGSASIIIAIIYALAKFLNLYNLIDNNLPINKDTIAEMATRVEDFDLKISAGYSDRYAISRGGLSFCSYVGKLLHSELGEEPLAVYDRIDKTYKIKSLPIIVCHSGIIHNSGSIHSQLRKAYLEKNSAIENLYRQIANISWKSRYAIMKRDWKLLGLYFKENTNVMNRVMKIAGFPYGIGSANNILIELIQDHSDVYAAKLTGAGGGGSVFALTKSSKVKDVLLYWKNKLIEVTTEKEIFRSKFPNYPEEIRIKLSSAQFFQIKIDKAGVKEFF
jgi:galactokinase/mevalonate kinase-like predicted kinase